jgi:signal transduction histidine kinase/ActR/RegA family two-component response regulator|tara:strand:+ start:745 stop:3003 length:2259 start_codon:yes stop_codon:yes gene_type:complete
MKTLYCFLLFSLLLLNANGQDSLIKENLDEKVKSSKQILFQQFLDSSQAHYDNGDYIKDLGLNFKLLKLALELDEPFYLYYGYRNLAYDYFAINDTILAKENFLKSEKQAQLSKNEKVKATSYMDMANFYAISIEGSEQAFGYFDKSIRILETLKDSVELAKAHYNVIITALQIGDPDKAYVHIVKAKKYAKHGDKSYLPAIDQLLGEYYFDKGNFEMSNTHTLNAIKVAEKENYKEVIEAAYYQYSESLFAQKEYKRAFEARKTYEEYYYLNQLQISSTQISEVSTNHQISEYKRNVKEAENQYQLQAQIVRSKSKLNTVLLFLSASFIIVLITLFYAYENRKKLVLELKIKNKEYLKAKEKSEQLTKSKSQFFSTVSHELRTPLYGVIGLSTILLEDKSLEKHEDDLKTLKFSADYLLALINDVLQINKIDSNNLEDEQTAFNLRSLIKEITSSFEYMRIQNKNRIHIHISEGIPKFILGNSVRLSQVLMNLIGNACKFTEDGDINIKVETVASTNSNTTIKFYIKDTGIGIPKNKLDSIFDEFSQANTIDYKYQGTGLGLPIVKKLLTLSSSKIDVESESGKGSMFSFSLPFQLTEQSEEIEDIPLTDTKNLWGKKILIVEDNRINQMVTKKILEKNNVICSIAENGNEAIKMVKKDEYDLILMDINMPKKNGIEATKEIRQFNTYVPILALTAAEVEEMRQQIYESGMNDIIVKPYDINKFTHTLLKNLNQNKPGQMERLRPQDVLSV